MEKKLKTLKEIINGKREYNYLVHSDDLRAEAVKRVKACLRPVDFTRNDRCGTTSEKFPYNYCDICQREIWFNNLIEEDLK